MFLAPKIYYFIFWYIFDVVVNRTLFKEDIFKKKIKERFKVYLIDSHLLLHNSQYNRIYPLSIKLSHPENLLIFGQNFRSS